MSFPKCTVLYELASGMQSSYHALVDLTVGVNCFVKSALDNSIKRIFNSFYLKKPAKYQLDLHKICLLKSKINQSSCRNVDRKKTKNDKFL